jgi:hypothetical protein
MEGSQNVRIELLYDLAIPPLGVWGWRDICTTMLTAELIIHKS